MAKRDVRRIVAQGAFDDRWTGETTSWVSDGSIFDMNLHSKYGVKKRVLPNGRTLAIAECLKNIETIMSDVEFDDIKYGRHKCFEDPFEFIDKGEIAQLKRDYVDNLVDSNSDKPEDFRNQLKSDIMKVYYKTDWNFGGEK